MAKRNSSSKPKTSSTKPERGLGYWLTVGALVIAAIITCVGSIFVALAGPFAKQIADITVPEMLATATLTPSPLPTFTSTPTQTFTPSPTPCAETSPARYGFDCARKLWSKTTDKNSLAIVDVSAIQKDRDGHLSTVLALTVDFRGSPEDRAATSREKGEVEVDLDALVPTGYEGRTVGEDLVGKTITAYVWVPKDAMGFSEHMNGFQLFLKDENYVSCYGTWSNIETSKEEIWYRIAWIEPSTEEKQAHPERCDPNFNIHKPKIIGLKIAVGEKSDISDMDLFTFFLDDIDWPSSTPTTTP